MRWKSREIMREILSGVVTIKQPVIRIGSVTIRWESWKTKTKMEGRKNCVACTIARVIQIKECFQQKSGSKSKDNSAVDGRNSEEHETYVVDSTTVDCKSWSHTPPQAAQNRCSAVVLYEQQQERRTHVL